GRDLLGRPKPSAGPSLLPLRAKPAARIVVHGVGRDAHLRAGPRRAGKREGGQAARLRPTLPLGAGPRQGGPGGSRARPAPTQPAATRSRAVAPRWTRGSGGLKSEAGTPAAGDHLEPSGSPPVGKKGPGGSGGGAHRGRGA